MNSKFQSYSKFLPWLTALLLSALVAACGGGGGDPIAGGGGNTGIAATVTVVTPIPNAVGVPINTKIITAVFTKAMDPATLTSATFTLACPAATPVSGTVSYLATGNIATLTLAAAGNLPPNTLCTATVTTGVKDTEGISLASNFSWTFTTAAAPDTTAPTVTATLNANGATNVAINTKVGATFSKAMDPLTITAATFTLKQGTTAVAGVVTYVGVNAVFTPVSNLAVNTIYTATVTTGAKDVSGNALASNFVWSWTTGAAPDTTAPTVTLAIPANSATSIAINTKIGATFSEAMDPLSITNLNYTLKETTSSAAVTGVVSYTGVNAVFVPLNTLKASTQYTATVKGGVGGVKDLAGNPLASDFVISWTTGAAPDIIPPVVNLTTPLANATGVAINTKVNATFSEAMDPLTVTNLNYTLKETVSGAAVTGTVSYSGVNAVFVPLGTLAGSTKYTITIKSGVGGVKDLAGNPLASDFVISWTTGVAPDTTAPTVSSTTIGNGATGVPINAVVGATFSEAMDPLTVNTATFSLVQTAGGGIVLGTTTYSGLDAVFTLSGQLSGNSPYTATISTGAKDLAGNSLTKDYVWSFTTSTAVIPPVANLLGRAANFGVLVGQSGSATLTNNGLATTVNGDVGATTQTTSPTLGSGYTNYQLVGDAAYQNALTDMTAAITNINGRTCDFNYGVATDFGGLTLAPGVHCVAGAMSVGSTLSLSTPGNYYFRSTGGLTSASTITVQFTGTANAANTSVFWVPVGGATLNANNTFIGTILSSTAAITLGANTTLLPGRVMSGSAVTLSTNTITRPFP
ncbi:MAG: Ig-like domain-containing protein [Betaproteobacteria bacterium]|nr:Ig-like domain-containing protein [Betaproteobacteria bacterium]